jgi:hypothetical protein
MSLENVTEKQIRKFYARMAGSGREVQRVQLDDVSGQIRPCSHESN